MGGQPTGVVHLAARNDDPHGASTYSDPVSAPDVRPARARDLLLLTGLADGARDGSMVLVASDPPVGFAHVTFPDGHAHLAQLAVWAEQDDDHIRDALLQAACEQLSVRGHGQVTTLVGAGEVRSGFEPLSAEEPRAAHQLELEQEAESTARTLSRRTLRRHRTVEELLAFLPTLDAAPRDEGTVRLVVRRPAVGAREVLDLGELDPAVGLVGDSWRARGSRRTPDGSAHPDMQLNVMNHRLIEFAAQDAEREALAGDQLFLDLDLSHDNLPAWSRLAFGEPGDGGAVIEVTDQPHNGCAKFIARFGKDAMAFVNGPEGKPRRLRGLCARVVQAGAVRPGDVVRVTRPTP